jgi:predicted RNase H-like HicB family nuclease
MENNFDIHQWQAKHLVNLLKENTVQESEGYVEVMGPDFDQAIELLQSAWEEWKNGRATEPEDIPQAKQDILDYVASLLQ